MLASMYKKFNFEGSTVLWAHLPAPKAAKQKHSQYGKYDSTDA